MFVFAKIPKSWNKLFLVILVLNVIPLLTANGAIKNAKAGRHKHIFQVHCTYKHAGFLDLSPESGINVTFFPIWNTPFTKLQIETSLHPKSKGKCVKKYLVSVITLLCHLEMIPLYVIATLSNLSLPCFITLNRKFFLLFIRPSIASTKHWPETLLRQMVNTWQSCQVAKFSHHVFPDIQFNNGVKELFERFMLFAHSL